MEIRVRENNDKYENIVGSMFEILFWVDIMDLFFLKCCGIVIVFIVIGLVNLMRRFMIVKFIRRDNVCFRCF